MPVTTIVGLAVIFAMFAVFIVSVGGAAIWTALPDWRKAAEARRTASVRGQAVTPGGRPA